MSYAGKFINSKGQDCTIARTVPMQTKISIRRSTKASRDLGIREGYWEGLIPFSANLESGEIVAVRGVNYLIQTVNYDQSSTETVFFAVKCNITIEHKRFEESLDDDNNLSGKWDYVDEDKTSSPAYGEVITSRLRQEDAGILEGTIYITQVPKNLGVLMLDRIKFSGKNYQVASIDDIGLSGVSRIQLEKDLRP